VLVLNATDLFSDCALYRSLGNNEEQNGTQDRLPWLRGAVANFALSGPEKNSEALASLYSNKELAA
jgi:hypothetical protein